MIWTVIGSERFQKQRATRPPSLRTSLGGASWISRTWWDSIHFAPASNGRKACPPALGLNGQLNQRAQCRRFRHAMASCPLGLSLEIAGRLHSPQNTKTLSVTLLLKRAQLWCAGVTAGAGSPRGLMQQVIPPTFDCSKTSIDVCFEQASWCQVHGYKCAICLLLSIICW